MLTSPVLEATGFVRSRPELPAPDLQLAFGPALYSGDPRLVITGHGFSIGVFLLPLTSGILQSSGRFGLLAFPLFLVLADLGLRHRTFHRAYMVFAPTAQIVLFSYVALGYLVP